MIGVAAILALAAATAAPSKAGFEAFQTLCLATGGDPAAAIAAADRAGWTALPQEQLATLAEGVDDPKSYQARTLRTPEGFMILGADRSAVVISDVSLRINGCQLSFSPGDYNAAAASAKTWAAVPASTQVPAEQGVMFVFAEDRGRHLGIADADLERAMEAQLRDHKVMQLSVYNLSRGPSLRLTVFGR